MTQLPFVTALCPTYRHPELLANSLALWLIQQYPLDRRELLILDDDPTFYSQADTGWRLEAIVPRMPTISDKYNRLLEMASPETEIVLVWEDDDIYFPSYVKHHVEALKDAEFSKSKTVLSDYNKHRNPAPGEKWVEGMMVEGSVGRFHSSMAFRYSLLARIGGWPETKRADFDQQLIGRALKEAKGIAEPWPIDYPPEKIPFCYRWHSGAAHCQSTMRSPDDETWYDRGEFAYTPVNFVGKLEPRLDPFTTVKLVGWYQRTDTQ